MRIENHSSWIDLVFKISSTYFRINIWMHTADVLGQELLTIIHSKVFSGKRMTKKAKNSRFELLF